MIFENIPFADHNAMLDPPTADITGRILEMLAAYGYPREDPRVERAIAFVFSLQETRRKLVWPLGRQLRLRHFPGAARALRDRRRSPGPAHPAGGGLASPGPESGRRLGRNGRNVRRARHAGIGAEHPVADGLGAAGPPGRRGGPLRQRRPGRPVAALPAAARRQLGRIRRHRPLPPGPVYGHGISPGVLSGLPPVSTILPLAGPCRLSAGKGARLLSGAELFTDHGHSHFPDVHRCHLRAEATAARQPTLSAGPDAGAPLPLQPRLRGLRQGAVSSAHPQEAAHARTVLCGRGGMRRPDGLAARRRTAAAPADRRDRQWPGRTQEVHLSVHQCPGAQAPPAGVHPLQIPHLFGAPGRAARAPRLLGLPRGRLRHRRRGHPGGGQARLPRDHQRHLLRRDRSELRPRLLRRGDGDGGRGHRAVPGLQLRQGAGPEPFHGAGPRPAALPRDPVQPQAQLEVQHVALVPRVPDGRAQLRVHALGLAGLQHLRLAAPLLSSAGRLRGDLPGAARDHQVGGLRGGQRQPQVRQLHGQLRLRAHRRDGRLRLAGRFPGDGARNLQHLSATRRRCRC